MAKVSVLMAVRNAAAFLPASLDSLISQTFSDWEALCVDDASTDDSLSVLQAYAARDSRILVRSKTVSGGAFLARQEGLELATGAYVTMLDADDWLAPDALELAVALLDGNADSDVVLYDLRMVFADHEEQFPLLSSCLRGEEAFCRSLTWDIHGVSMMRCELCAVSLKPLEESPKALQLLNSDEQATQLRYLYSRGVRQCGGIYYYRQHEESSTRRVSVRRFDVLRGEELMNRFLATKGMSREIRDAYESHRWLTLVDLYMFYHCHGRQLSAEERRKGLGELRQTWCSVRRDALKKETTAKFGYRPCRWWWLFRMQEWLYFTLRGLFGRNH